MAAPLPGSSVEQHVGFSQPPQEPASGEGKKKKENVASDLQCSGWSVGTTVGISIHHIGHG